jgi:GTP cyclohydrolase IA
MSDAYIFLGSNIEREKNYPEAVKRLRELGTLVAASPVYDTPALRGGKNAAQDSAAPRFYNGAVWLKTALSPHALRNALREIEAAMGRVRTPDKDAPRVIDLDLVLYDEVMMDDGELTLPDPLIFERSFMVRALAHVNPDYVIPPDGPTLGELSCRLRDEMDDMSEVPEATLQVQRLVQTSFKERARMSGEDSLLPPRVDAGWEPTPMAEDSESPGAETRIDLDRETARREIAEAVRAILLNVGEDPARKGLLKTPERVARAYEELLSGYWVDPAALVNGALFETDYNGMVVVKDIEFYSLCEHHLLPFFGKVHVAYIPDGKVIGLSKIPRIVEMYARRLQLQEKMTNEIADFLQVRLNPRGIAVIVTAQHMCSMMRGVGKQHSKMLTQVMAGEFQDREVREILNDRLRQDD